MCIYVHIYICAYKLTCKFMYTCTYTNIFIPIYIISYPHIITYRVGIRTSTRVLKNMYSVLHLECHFFNLISQSMI